MLTRSLGIGETAEVDIFDTDLNGVSYVFLCSDGLSNNLSTEEMSQILTQSDVSNQDKSQALINQSYSNGSDDNISLILLDFKQLRQGGC